jgi:lysyl-tRNA synthetase class 2
VRSFVAPSDFSCPHYHPHIMSATNLFEQERRQKADQLRELGIDPFGGPETGLVLLDQIKSLFRPEMGHDGGPVVKAAGRIILKRDMGKLSFLTLRDQSGDLQVALDKKRLDETAWQVRGLLDLADQIVVEGLLGQTNKGEITIWATRLRMASKALLPPPAKWEGLSDMELRYRQRYVDLWANPEVMRLFRLRSQIVDDIRQYLREKGYVEVETPMMQPLAGGAAARPFITHHNALDMTLYLRIAPELYLKRLLVGGFSKVFELNRNFRNEGISPRHNPEFTMLEAYEAYGSWETMATLVEDLICHLAWHVQNSLIIPRQPQFLSPKTHIDLTPPWPRISMVDIVEKYTGWRFNKEDIHVNGGIGKVYEAANRLRVEDYEKYISIQNDLGLVETLKFEMKQYGSDLAGEIHRVIGDIDNPAEQLVFIYEKVVEPRLVDPCFVTHVPSVVIPLAKKNRDDPYFADVYELAINGIEISPGYSELNDPDVQAANFAHQVGDEEEKQKVDEDFLDALRCGMPPAGGMGLGIDRLVAMLTGAQSLRDVILFPLMKPVEGT